VIEIPETIVFRHKLHALAFFINAISERSNVGQAHGASLEFKGELKRCLY